MIIEGKEMKPAPMILFIILVTSCFACGKHNWKHNTIPESKWNKDIADCVNQAELKSGIKWAGDPWNTQVEIAEARVIFNQCMEGKGYYQ